jgi:transcriptional/translational regulatory protein YebC/TACO1
MGATGSVAWNFDRRGVYFVPGEPGQEEQVLEAALMAEADDCAAMEGGFEVTGDPARFAQVKDSLIEAGFKPEKSEIVWIAKNTVTLNDEQVGQLVRMIDELDELDDVQSTDTNIEWTEAALAAAERAD